MYIASDEQGEYTFDGCQGYGSHQCGVQPSGICEGPGQAITKKVGQNNYTQCILLVSKVFFCGFTEYNVSARNT